MSEDNHVKIFFRFYSDILDKETTEVLSAAVFEEEYGYYKLTSIPFYVQKTASGDIVWAEYSEAEGMLTYRKTIEYSGNSTIHVIILDNDYEIDAICSIFEAMGCRTAKLNHQYFGLEIPANMTYIPVKRRLDELEKEGVLDYAESGLFEKHQYKDISFGS